jgi:uncharacterized membrane-anchored protein
MDAVMRISVRARTTDALPGLVGSARTDRRTQHLLPRLQAGDVAVLDHVDLDRTTAQALVSAGVAAVVNAEPMVSGRFPNQGPQVLLDAGVLVLDAVGAEGVAAVRDGRRVRLHGDALLAARPTGGDDGTGAEPPDDAGLVLARGRVLDQSTLDADLERARSGMAAQLETLTHTTGELLRREQDLLLHGRGLPRLATAVEGRPVVVVTAASESAARLAGMAAYLREQHPVLVAVGAGAEVLRAAGHRPDVLVIDAAAGARGGETVALPPATQLRAARDVVVRCERGGGRDVVEQLERIGVRALRVETSLASEDAALLLADAAGATLVVGVGCGGDLADLLDRRRGGVAGTHLVRLRLGDRLVDAAAVQRLYAGRVRPWHLLVVMVVGLVALAAAVAVTPVGHEWFRSWTQQLSDWYATVR